MGNSISELLLNYARLGVRRWSGESPLLKTKAREIRVDIAATPSAAEFAVTTPYRVGGIAGRQPVLIPMPCGQRKVYAAFFAPWLGSSHAPDQLSFDLVVLVRQGKPIAFRIEPGSDYPRTSHGYDHIQLNESLFGGKTKLANVLSPLAMTYPAFPIPSKSTIDRFLALAVAMHGYPSGVDTIFREAFNGQPLKIQSYMNLTRSLLTVSI